MLQRFKIVLQGAIRLSQGPTIPCQTCHRCSKFHKISPRTAERGGVWQVRIVSKPSEWPAEAAKQAEQACLAQTNALLKMSHISNLVSKINDRTPGPETPGVQEAPLTPFEQDREDRIKHNKTVSTPGHLKIVKTPAFSVKVYHALVSILCKSGRIQWQRASSQLLMWVLRQRESRKSMQR